MRKDVELDCLDLIDRHEGVDLLRYDDDARVAELVVMVPPASALVAVRDAVAAGLQSATDTGTDP